LLHALCAGEVNRVSTQLMGEAALQGEKSIQRVIARAGEFLGIAAANAISALHPQLVVLGGGVAELGELLLAPMRATVRERVGMFPTDDVRIVRSELGD